MKKHLLILLALTTGLFASCNKNDNGKENKYVFYEPVMTWNAGMSDIRTEMNKMTGWVEDTEMSEENTLVFANKNNEAVQLSYEFVKEKMTEIYISYTECNDKFNQMKDDWAKALNLVWKQDSRLGDDVYLAECKSKKCTVIAQKGNASGIDWMSISFQYTEIFF